MAKLKKEVELRVGFFVVLGVGLIMLAIILLGGAEGIIKRKSSYITYFDNVHGLITGAKVVLNGIRVGLVDQVKFDPQKKQIKVAMTIFEEHLSWVKNSSEASIETQGVLGDKYISIETESLDSPELPPGSVIPSKASSQINQFLSDGEKLVQTLKSISTSLDRTLKELNRNQRSTRLFEGLATTSQNLSQISSDLKTTTKTINSVVGKVDSGKGTIGALVNDPGLYEDIRSLVGGANRNRVVRNLVRKMIRDSEEEEQNKKP